MSCGKLVFLDFTRGAILMTDTDGKNEKVCVSAFCDHPDGLALHVRRAPRTKIKKNQENKKNKKNKKNQTKKLKTAMEENETTMHIKKKIKINVTKKITIKKDKINKINKNNNNKKINKKNKKKIKNELVVFWGNMGSPTPAPAQRDKFDFHRRNGSLCAAALFSGNFTAAALPTRRPRQLANLTPQRIREHENKNNNKKNNNFIFFSSSASSSASASSASASSTTQAKQRKGKKDASFEKNKNLKNLKKFKKIKQSEKKIKSKNPVENGLITTAKQLAVTRDGKAIFFCDREGHAVKKYNTETEEVVPLVYVHEVMAAQDLKKSNYKFKENNLKKEQEEEEEENENEEKKYEENVEKKNNNKINNKCLTEEAELAADGCIPNSSEDLKHFCVGIALDEIHNYIYFTVKGPSKGGCGAIFAAPYRFSTNNLDLTEVKKHNKKIKIKINHKKNKNKKIKKGIKIIKKKANTASLSSRRPLPEGVIPPECVLMLKNHLPEPIDLLIDGKNNFLYWTDRGDDAMGGNSFNRTTLRYFSNRAHRNHYGFVKKQEQNNQNRNQQKILESEENETEAADNKNNKNNSKKNVDDSKEEEYVKICCDPVTGECVCRRCCEKNKNNNKNNNCNIYNNNNNNIKSEDGCCCCCCCAVHNHHDAEHSKVNNKKINSEKNKNNNNNNYYYPDEEKCCGDGECCCCCCRLPIPLNYPKLGKSHEVLFTGFKEAIGATWAADAVCFCPKKKIKNKKNGNNEKEKSSDADIVYITDMSGAVYRCDLKTRKREIIYQREGSSLTGITYLCLC